MKHLIISCLLVLFLRGELLAESPAQSIQVILPERHTTVIGNLYRVFTRIILEHSPNIIISTNTKADIIIEWKISKGIGAEGYTISDGDGGSLVITGNDELGLIYGVGKFLHTSRYVKDRVIISKWRGKNVPSGQTRIRGLYFATHFGHVLDKGNPKWLKEYIEELILWGMNHFIVWYHPTFSSYDSPEAIDKLNYLAGLLKAAESLGVKTGIVVCVNNVPANSLPPEKQAKRVRDDYARRQGCPSIPDVWDIIMDGHEKVFKRLAECGVNLSFVWNWGIDDGGCFCDDCIPWFSNGYIKCSNEINKRLKKYHTNYATNGWAALSGWACHEESLKYVPKEGWQQWLEKNKPDWLTYLICVETLEPSLKKQGVSLIDFPEISMHMTPWGGFGANVNPFHIAKGEHDGQRTSGLGKSDCIGGFSYCEGIYEDMDKIGCLMHYWNPDTLNGEDIIREYVEYYFSPEIADELIPAIKILEENEQNNYLILNERPNLMVVGFQKWVKSDEENVPKNKFGEKLVVVTLEERTETVKAYNIIMSLDKKLPENIRVSWRWRMIYLRAVMDNYLHNNKGVIPPKDMWYKKEFFKDKKYGEFLQTWDEISYINSGKFTY